jgi:hypothetical protein
MVPDGISIRIEMQMQHVLCKINKSQHGLLLSVYFGTTDVVSSLYTRITPTMMITHVFFVIHKDYSCNDEARDHLKDGI